MCECSLWSCSLRASAGLVNCRSWAHLLIAQPRFFGRAAASGQRKHPDHADLAVERKGEHTADLDLVARLFDPLAVDADMTFPDECLGKRSALQQPDEEQEAIDPQRPTA